MPRNLSVVAGGTAAVMLLGVVTGLIFREPATAGRPLGGPLVVVVPQVAPPVGATPDPAVAVAATPAPSTAMAMAGQPAGPASPTPPQGARNEAPVGPTTAPAPPPGDDGIADEALSASNEYWTPPTSSWWTARDDVEARHDSDDHHWSTPDPEQTSDSAASRSGERLSTEVCETALGSRYGPGAPR